MLRINKLANNYLVNVIGTIISCLPAVIAGPFFYFYFENNKATSLRLNKGNVDPPAKISPKGKEALEWWFENTDKI